ncbi:MAG: C25 family cysteine peptidase [Bacteroidales bacterium]|nr:C25 family cysteine peptidase [Bacteroidales bacterium]
MFKFLSKKLLVITLLALATSVFAQDQILTVGANHEMKNETVLTFQNDNQTTIRFDLNEVELIEIETGNGNAFIATSDNAPLMLQEGSPEMFYLTTAFIIPDQGSSELEISYGQFQEFDNIEIAPSKGNLTRNIDPATVPFVKGAVYQYDGFFPGTLASLREPFIMRDVRGQSLDVYPVQYNPVTKVLRVYSEITVTVRYTETEGVNEFTDQKRHTTIEPQFNEMYKDLFINNSVMQSRGYPTGEEGELLIICHTAFVNDMQPYVDWKRTAGRKTTIVPTSTTGTTAAAIKTYITNYYNNPSNNLAYVLLVGDHPQLPPHQVGTIRSDVEYGKLTGGDNYLEILIGRMSCETVAHVQTQVQRTINYERDLNTSDTWISTAVGLAANEGNGYGHDGGEADYVHMNNIRTRLLTYGYTTVHQEYAGVGSGTNNTQISSRFNAGASMANYCNHGSPTAWTFNPSPTYSNTQVNALTNAGKLPFIFSVACNNGEFGPWQYNNSDAVCFAETWLRATQSGQPTGAVAFFGATISISWHPPMTAQDEFINICLDLPSQYGGTQPGIKRTFAGAALNATQKMIMVHGSGGVNDYNSWLVFGDPALMIRTKTPQTMTVTHNTTIPSGATSFTVNCNVNDALVSMSYIDTNNEVVILGTKVVAGGVANVTLNPAVSIGPITVCVTGRDRVTYLGTVTVSGSSHIPVTDITGVSGTATATLPLTLTGTVVPSDATNKTITWSVQNAGTTGATITGGNILNTTNSGTATILATIVNGAGPSTNYTKPFTITVTKATLGGTVTVSGSTVFGQTLTAVTSALTSSPVIPALGTLSYQWQRGTTNISGATSATYTLVQADIGNTIRVVVSAANCTGSATSANTATVTKATQTAPPAPTMASNTSTSITLNTVAGCEYNISGGAYKDSPTFDNLTASTSYPFTQRLKETATHLASPSSPVANLSTDAGVIPTYIITSTVNNPDFGTITPYGDITVEEGDDITFTIAPKECYYIETVSVDGVNNPAAVTTGVYTFENVDDDHTIHVAFKPIEYTITAISTNGSIDPAGEVPVNCGDSKTFIFSADSGYKIEEVLIDGVNNPTAVANGTYTFTNVTTTGHTIEVICIAITGTTHEITVGTDGNGTISPSGGAEGIVIVAEGDDIAFNIFPNDGYKIEEVLVDGVNKPAAVENGFYTFENVMEDHEIYVVFAEEVGIVETPFMAPVRVYPNPTSGLLTICDMRCAMCDVAIFDVMGRAVVVAPVEARHATSLQSEITFDLSNVPAGVYFLRITTDEGVVVRKVVKE